MRRSVGDALRRDRWLAGALVALALASGLLVLRSLPSSAAAPEGRVAVADLRGQALVVADLAAGTQRRIALPGGPHELLALPDGRVAASLEQSGALALVDPVSGAVEVREVGGAPHGLALDGAVLLVTDRAAGQVRRFDLASGDELPPVAAGGWPHAVAVLGDGRLAVAHAASSTLTLGERVLPVSALPETVAVSGDRVATAGALGGALEVFASDGTPVHGAWVGGRPVRVVFDGTGSLVAGALSASGEVVLLDPAGGAPRRLRVGGVPDGLAFSADGRWLFVGDLSGGRLRVVEVASGALLAGPEIGGSVGSIVALPGAS